MYCVAVRSSRSSPTPSRPLVGSLSGYDPGYTLDVTGMPYYFIKLFTSNPIPHSSKPNDLELIASLKNFKEIDKK